MSQPLPEQQTNGKQERGQQAPPNSQRGRPKKSRSRRNTTKTQIISVSITASASIIAALIGGYFLYLSNRTASQTLAPVVSTSPAIATPSPILTSSPSSYASSYPPPGWELVIDNSMKSNDGNWSEGDKGSDGSCRFTKDGYQIRALFPTYLMFCNQSYRDFTNFALEIKMTIVEGDEGGVVFYSNENNASFYLLRIGQKGTCILEFWENNQLSRVLGSYSSTTIHSGLNQANLIALLVQGNVFNLYVNHQLIANVTDKQSLAKHGSIGLIANAINNQTEVLYSNLKVWTPSS